MLLMIVLHLLISDRVRSRTHCLFDDHATSITTSISLLPQCSRVHLTSRSSRVDGVFLNYLVYAVIVLSLDHGAMLALQVLGITVLL